MDEEVINDLYNRAKSKGYQKSLEEFVSLLHSDQEVFNDMYGYVQSKGYKKGTEGFSALIGKTQQQPAQQQTTQIQSLTQQQPVKKKELSASLLEGGLSGWLGSSIEGFVEKYQPRVEEDKPEDVSTWKRKVKREPEIFDFGMSEYFPNKPKSGTGVLLSEKKYPLSFLGRRTQEQIEEEVPEFIRPVINNIDDKLLRQGKENAKKELNYYLWDAGFETKILSSYETGTAVDMISITAPDGEVRQFQVFSDFDNEANKIKQFVKEKSSLIPKKEEYWYQNQYRKFKNKEEIDNEVKSISNQENLINKEYNQYLYKQSLIKEWKADIKKMEDSGEQNTLKYKNWVANLKIYEAELPELGDRLKNKASTLIEQQKQLEKAAGKYLELQSEKGTFSGALYRSAMESAANIYSQYLRLTYSGMVELLPGSAVYSQKQFDTALRKRLFDEGMIERMDDPVYKIGDAAKYETIKREVDAELRDKLKKQGITGYRDGVKLDNVASVNSIRENISEFLNRPTSTTKEYKEKLEKEGSFVTRGLLGLSGSLPAMLGGPAIRITNMFMMTTDAAMREMDNDPDFANISENEKALVALPIGVVSAALEEVGFRNLVKGKSVTSDILKTVLNRVPSNASASLLRKTTLDVIAEMGIRGTTALVGAALSEAETGAAQQISEYIVKDSYNMLKGKKMFDNPEFLSSQYFYDIYDASRTEMVGGITLGVPYSISAAFQKDGFQALDDNTFKIFEELTKDGDSRKFFVTSLKNKINQGEITAKQSQQMLDAYDQASGMIAQVPDEITDSKARKIAMDLMSERKRLEQKKYGKDEALAKPIQDKIDNINKQLTQLTEDAIQKQTTGEVSVQPEAGAGQEVEVGGPETKPQITAEESKRKEDLLAALEATDKDVIAIGDELLDRKEAQAELEAITQKEQAPVTEQGGMEQAPAKMSTTEALTSTPTETKAGVTFVAPDGNEVALEGNEQVAAQLYDDAVAVAEEQRTPEQNDIIQKMQPIVTAAAPAVEVTPTEVTPAEVTTTETTATEVTPVEQQFTEQDRARKAELEEAMRKADKRRKNITVGETTMPKAEAKAELDALNQKEQATQQPVTPAVEAAPTVTAPTATAPVETMTAEQEADLLEELMTGKKKEPVVTETVTPAATTTPTAEVKAEPTSKEAIAKRLRGKKNKGLMSSIDFGISQALYNGALEFMASQVEKGTKLGNAIENTIKWIDEKMQGKSWNKDGFTKYANTTFEEVATKKKAKAILDVYPKGSVVGIADLASESGDTIISNVLSKMKDVFNKVKISGRRPTEGAAFYNYNTKEIDVNKNSPHWDEVEGDQIASALSHEFAHHLIDGHSEKEAIETDLQEIKDDLIANKPELTESQKKAYEFMTSKNNSPQEILTYAVSDPDIRPILTKYKDKLNNISNKLFGEDVISGIFEEQKSKTNEIQPQRTRDGRGRTESRAIAPLEGAPSVQGFVGPDPQLTAVAEEYAKENGIPYKRQAEYVKVDEDRAKRIAEAYEEMKHDPQNPKVKEAYENLIKQTIAQYEALIKAGYKFWFIDTNIPSNLEYAQSPFNAMRDVRSNKQMGVFPTTDGFGSSDVDVSDNPMMAETKFKWPVGGMDGELKPVLANDLFRAVHDAFGHGLEGAGFRARGEENAWQAHIRLFTGSAVGAITSETRGQNSWLNFGPHGEKNRAANTDETIFADQKTGLMPEWTWKEGVAADMETTAKPKATSLADAVRKNLTIKTGGLQSNILGVPIAIWNAGVLTAAKAIDASVSASKAIQQGVNDVKNWIKKNNPSLSLSDAKIKNKILIDLYESTIKTARENNVKTEGLITYFKRKGLSDAQIDVLLKDEKKKSEKPELSEETLPGYTKLMNRINDIIARGRRNGKTDDDIMKGVIANVESRSPEYANATDQQREQIIRDIRKLFGKKEKAAPSAAKITGKAKPKKVTVDEMTALKDQLRLEAKAAREAKGDLNTKRKMLADAINKMAKKGSITVRQAKILIDRVNSVNLDNPVMVERLLDYAEKVFNDADYADKLSQAKDLQSTAKSLSGNKEKNPEVRELAKKFAEIDPALVENIDEYIEMASAVVEGLKGSKLTAKGVSLADAVDINETSKYIEKALEQQAEKQKQMMADKMQSLMGVDVSDLTYDQLLELLDDSSKPIDKYKETIIRDIINKMFDTYSGIIESMLETGKDPFNISEDAETIEFKDSTKQVVRNFMSIDLNSLSPREALKAVDALNNFIVNGSTANMETVYNTYLANKNAKEVKQKGVKGKKLTFFFVPSLGRMLLDEFASLPLLLESMFKSTNVALYFSRMSGLSNLMNGAARATTITQKTIARYLDTFSKLKPNGKAFNDAYNATERGMVAFMSRNLIGSEAKMKKEFNDRKSLVEKSIEELSKGTAKEQEKAKLYQEAYDKILDGSENAQQVKDKAAKENVEAVDWWINEWSKHFDELSDVSLNVYNKVLDRDLNYTTDRYSKLDLAAKDESVLDSNASAYHFNNGTMYKKEAGALKETTDKTGELPKNKDGEVTRYVDLSFDSIQASSLYDAMADIKTAGAIRQVDAFFKSKDTRSLFSAEDFKLLDERVKLAIRNIRNQQSYDNGEIEKLVKALDKFAKYSASIALAGVTQPFKQTVPLMFNTLINAGQFDPFGVTFNKDIKNFIDESGRAIANRGVESQVYIESINRLIDEAAKSKGEAALKLIERANDLWMKVFLANPDRYIARASWMAYYEQSLKKQGKYGTVKKITLPSGATTEVYIKNSIDYATHELNEEAADYAQMMVDRQQNITDTKLAGRMYSDTEGGSWKKILTRMLLPLASFRLNQFIRAKSDTATLFSKTTTLQDKTKAARSLSGMAAEMLVFKSMVIGFGLTWHYISDAILAAITGDEEDEEESEKKWKVRFNNLVKGQATSAVTDLFSPIPILDPFVKYGANTALDVTQDFLKVADDDKFKLFVDDLKSPKTYASSAGMYGIGLDKINEIFKTSNLAITGKFIDDRGHERFIRDEQRSLLSWSIIPSVIFNAGLLPGAPEFNNITGKITKDIKYSGMTEKQMDVYKKTGLDKDEIKKSKEKAFKGYSSEKQFEENDPEGYLKAVEDGTIYDYRKQQQDIRIATEEMSPEQLYKVNPTLWKKKYGPGTDYYKQQRTPAARKKAREEQRYKAEVKAKAEAVEAKRQREEARKKRRY